MRSAKSKSRHSLSTGSEHFGDDGVDPRSFFDRRTYGRSNRKAQQLCRQVERTLQYVLSGECDDDVLRNLTVTQVVPAPNASRMLVVVAPLFDDGHSSIEILEHLGRVTPRLRAAIAASIHRKRTPDLAFQVSAPPSA